ncbi:MAG: tetratricopeptide repeat protein [Bryobacterales bacterium]|nr:tetratricopeptide repeat protein [Bryobacterales bacterium]
MALYQSVDQQLMRRHAVLWNKIGIAYHQMLDMDAAARCYRESLKTDARYSEARNNLGTVHYTQKQYGRAVSEYKRSLELTPNSASVHSNLGTAYFSQKRYEEASTHYARAVEIDPLIFEHRGSQGTILQQRNVEDRASFHFHLSKVYARNGDVERSLLYMRKALEEGFKDRRKFREDQDFAAMQDIEEFQTLLTMEFRVL